MAAATRAHSAVRPCDPASRSAGGERRLSPRPASRPAVKRGEAPRGTQGIERPIDRFVSELWRMTPEERIRASRYTMSRWERWVYAARFPDEVPTVNGELEWIALTLE